VFDTSGTKASGKPQPFAEATGITIIIKGKISRIHRFFIALSSFRGISLPK
jgi:hypothetical protein